ncbi:MULTISPECIES: PilZ domain-containing protein [Pseudomonas]|uniref:Cyclic diguanosine monophosphate-binding protein n=1 Tax=Pseudomonas fluorescens TaxID=294 RepID=A0A5E6UPT1_PSEFL|nr:MULTISPECIES: PilZ domain-containing protein [Pseudomonas]VVN07825.1 Cyclic diguanosine monophosphate-binding protein [Pseudomonas fluorescens]
MSDHQERRRFKRIAFDAPTELVQGEHRWQVNLLDISLKGILIEYPEPWDADLEELFDAVIHLGEGAQVEMQVQLRHIDERQLGFICLHIDLHSLEHLCRLIELNLADRTELEREFHELIEV